jgi:hypothetical protein
MDLTPAQATEESSGAKPTMRQQKSYQAEKQRLALPSHKQNPAGWAGNERQTFSSGHHRGTEPDEQNYWLAKFGARQNHGNGAGLKITQRMEKSARARGLEHTWFLSADLRQTEEDQAERKFLRWQNKKQRRSDLEK